MIGFSTRLGLCLPTLLLLVLVIARFDLATCLNDVGNKEYALYKSLFQNYSSSIRPTKSWSDQLNVTMNINLFKVANVIENDQTMTIYASIEMNWVDTNLVWNPPDFDKIDSLNVPAEQVWVPDLHLFNSASEDDRISPANVEINSNGTVRSYPISQLYAHCDFDFSDFPYDMQICDFIIGTVIERSKVNLNLNVQGDETKILPNPEWIFRGIETADSSWVLTVPGVGSSNKLSISTDWSVTKFLIQVKRVSSFYVNLFVWPCIFILFIAMSMFILPPTCVERVTMGVLLLLTVVVMSLMLDSYTPKASTSISVIGRLIGFTMFMIAFATITSSLVVILDRDRFIYVAIPMWIKDLLLKYVGKAICRYGTLQGLLTSNQITRDEEIEILDPGRISSNGGQQQQPQQSSGGDGVTPSSAAGSNVATIATTSSGTDSLADMNQAKTMLVLINNQLAMMRIKAQEKDSKDQNKKDWHVVACAFDRMFLMVYAVMMFFGLFIIFV